MDKYIPCSMVCIEDPAPGDPDMIRGSCRHGAFSVCNSRSGAVRSTLDACFGYRVSDMFDDCIAGTHFSEIERQLLRRHRLLP